MTKLEEFYAKLNELNDLWFELASEGVLGKDTFWNDKKLYSSTEKGLAYREVTFCIPLLEVIPTVKPTSDEFIFRHYLPEIKHFEGLPPND